MFNILAPSISISDITSSKSKWRMESSSFTFRTEYQLADIFTKPLCRERIEFLIDKLRMRSFTHETLKELADEAEEYGDYPCSVCEAFVGFSLEAKHQGDVLNVVVKLLCDFRLEVRFMRILKLREVARMTARITLEFAPDYAFSVSLLLTPLCCDDIHDVTPRVSALAGGTNVVSKPMIYREQVLSLDYSLRVPHIDAFRAYVMSPPIRRKYHNSVAFATGCKRIKKSKRCNRKIRIPIAMWPCYETFEKEPVEQPRRHDLYGFVDHPQLQQGNPMNEFAPHRLPQPKGNMNGWLIEDEEEVERNEVDSDLESTASSKPVWKKTTKADHDRASSQIVIQVTNNVNNANNGNRGNGGGGNGNGGN
ncbi:hypothetical protein Tco_1185161, partial [Tanacetum coccineum]